MHRKLVNSAICSNAKRFISFLMAIAVILCSIPCVAMADDSVVTLNPKTDDGVNFDLLAEGNNIYFGAYNHATGTKTENGATEAEYESDTSGNFTPILWKITNVNDITPNTYKLTLMSAYVLDYAKASEIAGFVSDFPDGATNSKSHFTDFEKTLISSNSVSLISKNDFSVESSSAGRNERRATLKNAKTAEYLIEGNESDKYSTIATNGNLDVNAVNTSDTDKLYGIRLTMELTITANNVVQLSEIVSSSNGYSPGTTTSKNLKFTFVDSTEQYNNPTTLPSPPQNSAKLALTDVTASQKHKYDSDSNNELVLEDAVAITSASGGGNLNTEISVEASKSFAVEATSSHEFEAIGGDYDYSINYKIVNTDGQTAASGKALISPHAGENTMLIPTRKSFVSGRYIVYIWLQKNEKINSHVTSELAYFDITVTPNTDSEPTYNVNAPTTDFVIAVDYYREVIRLVDAETPKYSGKNYIEIGDELSSQTIAKEADDYYYNNGSNVVFMYAVKAVSDVVLSNFNPTKKADKLFSEKWYPIYGNTINLSKIIPRKIVPVGDKKGYYVAIRRADDPFIQGEGYASRKIVMLRGRIKESDLKRSIEYDSENEQFIFNGAKMSGSSVDVRYRFNYFLNFENATLYKSGTSTGSDTSPNISIPSELFSAGGTIYISMMPKIAGDYAVETAASREIKMSIPKKGNAPSIKVDSKNKRLTGLKKNSTTQYKTINGTWETYAGSATSADIATLSIIFPNILMEDDPNDNSVTIVYFRTKGSAKAPASLVAEVKIPESLMNP